MTPSNTKTKGTEEGQAAAKRIASAREERIANRNLTSGGVPVPNPIPASTTTPVITPAGLTPSQAPLVSPTPVPTAVPKLQADLEAVQEDILTQKVAAEKTAAEASKGTAYKSLLDQMAAAKGLSTLTSESYAQEGGVNDITPELNDINDQIRREQLASRRAQEVIQQGGGLKAGASSEISNIQRESLAKQADLSIIQMAVQGRYDSAKETADRAVQAQFEEQTQKMQIAQFDYNENKELFNKSEQREFDLLFANRERKLEEIKQNKQDMYALGVQASADGAPSSVIQQMFNAKTREEALAIGGSYIGALDRQVKQANIAQSYASIAAANAARVAAQSAGNENGTLNGKPQNVTQATANGFADRIAQANTTLSLLGKTFTGNMAFGGSLPNILQSGDRQAYEQAKKNFATAVLRRESGASIAPSEFETLNTTYFPVAGDKPDTIFLKDQLRNTVINSFYREANVARPVLPGDIVAGDDGAQYKVDVDGETLIPIE